MNSITSNKRNLNTKQQIDFSNEKSICNFSSEIFSNVLFDAIINNSVSSIREESRHQSQLINQALLGTPVKILKNEKEWLLVQTPNQYLGWINQNEIVKIDKTAFLDYRKTTKIIYHQQCGFSYSQPDVNSQVISDLVIGCILSVKNKNDEFYEVKYPDNRIAYVKKDEVVDIKTIFNKNPQKEALIKTAKKFLGTPYLWGGLSSKLIDCSGFTSLVYWLNGIVLQRDASQQMRQGKEITKEFFFGDLEIGDLLFFGQKATAKMPEKVTHVAMYTGDTEFIHASGRVKINSIDKSRPHYDPLLETEFIQTNRIINETNGGIEKIMQNNYYKNLISD